MKIEAEPPTSFFFLPAMEASLVAIGFYRQFILRFFDYYYYDGPRYDYNNKIYFIFLKV